MAKTDVTKPALTWHYNSELGENGGWLTGSDYTGFGGDPEGTAFCPVVKETRGGFYGFGRWVLAFDEPEEVFTLAGRGTSCDTLLEGKGWCEQEIKKVDVG